MANKTVLLLWGGGGSEHAISFRSFEFIKHSLSKLPQYRVVMGEFLAIDNIIVDQKPHVLNPDQKLYSLTEESNISIDFVIPCFHGPPGENGLIQALLSFYQIPYLGCHPEASKNCFNKLCTKLLAEHLQVQTAPFISLYEFSSHSLQQAKDFLQEYGQVFLKAASQGSSIGCYYLQHDKTDDKALEKTLREAFKLSSYVLLEQKIEGRELEVATYEYNGELTITPPGEIVCTQGFYDYHEKYDDTGQTHTVVEAEGLSQEILAQIESASSIIYKGLKIRHLSRLDFFLTQEGDLYLNEVNTFPGMTSISMFPKMLEAQGHSFTEFLGTIIEKEISI